MKNVPFHIHQSSRGRLSANFGRLFNLVPARHGDPRESSSAALLMALLATPIGCPLTCPDFKGFSFFFFFFCFSAQELNFQVVDSPWVVVIRKLPT